MNFESFDQDCDRQHCESHDENDYGHYKTSLNFGVRFKHKSALG